MERSRASWWLIIALPVLSVLVGLTALSPAGSRAMCPATEYSGTLRTPTNGPLPPDLPLLVVVVTDRTGTPAQMVQGSLVPLELRVTRGEFGQALSGRMVGPGLMAYQAAPPLAPGEYVLSGLREPVTLRVDAVTLPPLAPPQLGPIVHGEEELEGRWGGRQWTDSIPVTAALPAHAVALVFATGGAQAQLDLTPAMLGSVSTLTFSGGAGGHCGSTRPPNDYRLAGASARPSLVDHWGRVATAAADVAVSQEGALAQSRAGSSESGSRSPRCSATPGASRSAPWGLVALGLALVPLVRRRRRAAPFTGC
jgi:MYXO-CTERM domain-containing protein